MLWHWRFFGVVGMTVSFTSWGDARLDLPDLTEPLVFSPSRIPQEIGEAPATVTVITRAMIEASGATRLIDIMRLVPGVVMGTRSVEAPSVAYHGLGDQFARRSLLLLDGDRVFQFSRGVIDWNGIPVALRDVERVEVIRGPNGLYGSNAFDMVINLITRTPAESAGTEINLGIGSRRQSAVYARHGNSGDRTEWVFWGEVFGDDGYASLEDERRVGKIGFGSDVTLDARTTLELRAGLTRGDYDLDEPLAPTLRSLREMTNRTDYQSFRLRRIGGGGANEWRISVSRNGFTFGDHGWRSAELLPGVELVASSHIDEERFNVDGEWFGVGDRWKAAFGAGYYHETARSPGFFETMRSLSSEVYRAFATGEYRPPGRLWLNAGLMAEYGSLAGKLVLLPRLSVHFRPEPEQTLRLVYATGSRQPTLYEERSRAVAVSTDPPLTLYRSKASGSLDPEIKHLVELGWHWRPLPAARLDARVFYERIDDAIIQYFRVEPGLPTVLGEGRVLDFRNLAQPVEASGFEITFDYRLASGALLYGAYAYTDLDSDEPASDLAGTQPRHTVSALVSVPLDAQWTLSAAYNYRSGMHWLLEPALGPLHDLSVTLAREFDLGAGRRARFRVTGQRLFGGYADFLPDREHQPGVFAELRLEF